MAMLVIGPVGATQEKVPVRAAARTYSLLDAPSMTGAFFGVSMNFSAWSGGLPEYMASAGVSPRGMRSLFKAQGSGGGFEDLERMV